MKEKLSLIITLFLISSVFSEPNRKKIDLNDNWTFQLNGGETKTLNIPHDYSIIQNFDSSLEGESGFLPGGNAVYTKTFTLDYEGKNLNTFLYFYGVYKDAYIKINNVDIGENHYGYNSFCFNITNYIKTDGKSINTLEVKVEHELFSSRWYSGSGLFRGVFLQVLDPLHFAIDGLKVTTPDIAKGVGSIEVTTQIVNNADSDNTFQLNINVLDMSGEVLANIVTAKNQISKNSIKDFKNKLYITNPNLWNAENPYLYKVEVQMINDDDEVLDYDETKFGFRYFSFDNTKGFVINGVPTKLKGVCLHHDYGALGAIDNYDAFYKRLIQLKDMGINSIRTSHNIAHKVWLTLCDELGFYVIEEFFDGWKVAKNYNTNDFSKYFSVVISDTNEILGKESGMTWSEFAVSVTVKRDKNHPCIIMWSIGNEIPGIDASSADLGKSLITVAKKIDTTRAFTRADDSFRSTTQYQINLNKAIVNEWGMIGYNYAAQSYLKTGSDLYGSIYLSESASALNSRGVYSNIQNGGTYQVHDGHYHLTSYDVSYASWSSTANYALWETLCLDYVAGSFVWTGYDYIGEPTPWNGITPGSQTGEGPIPNTAYFGIIDTCNYPKDTYYLYRALYNLNAYTLHIVNAWDKNNICYSDTQKTKTPVHVYTNVQKFDVYRSDYSDAICSGTKQEVTTTAGYKYYVYSVESHNTNLCEVVESSSSDPGTQFFARFNILFDENTALYLKGYDDKGEVIDDDKVGGVHYIATPNTNSLKLKVNVDKTVLKNDGVSLAYVEVSIVDDKDILDSVWEDTVTFNLDSSDYGKILGVDNGDQATVDKFQEESVLIREDYAFIKAYRGKALAIVSSKNKEGVFKVTVSAGDLGSVEVSINVVPQ